MSDIFIRHTSLIDVCLTRTSRGIKKSTVEDYVIAISGTTRSRQ